MLLRPLRLRFPLPLGGAGLRRSHLLLGFGRLPLRFGIHHLSIGVASFERQSLFHRLINRLRILLTQLSDDIGYLSFLIQKQGKEAVNPLDGGRKIFGCECLPSVARRQVLQVLV